MFPQEYSRTGYYSKSITEILDPWQNDLSLMDKSGFSEKPFGCFAVGIPDGEFCLTQNLSDSMAELMGDIVYNVAQLAN